MEAEEVFAIIDQDRSGHLDLGEFTNFVRMVQMKSDYKTSYESLNNFVNEINKCKSETQSLWDFILLPFRWKISKKKIIFVH